MKKYLCVLDVSSGIVEISNIAVVFSSDTDNAAAAAVEIFGIDDDYLRKIKVYDIDTIADRWTYFV